VFGTPLTFLLETNRRSTSAVNSWQRILTGKDDYMQSEEAIKVFMQRVEIRSYKAALEEVISLLKSGPIGLNPKANEIELHEWYENLNDDNKLKIEEIIKKTAFHSIFGFLMILDNLTMGYPIEGEVSDFALYIQSYSDKTSRSLNQPKEVFRINHPKNISSLHDLISGYIK
jgi:hypothetical protein